MTHPRATPALRGCEDTAELRILSNNIAPNIEYQKQYLMDKLDAKILELLQVDGALSAAEIADRIGLSKTPCWRRIQKLQDEGIIRGTVALLDARALNVGTTVFVTLKTGNHSEACSSASRVRCATFPK